MATGCRHIVFTINNPVLTPEELWAKAKDHARYLIFNKEKAPETGTIHYQGYIEFFKQKRYGWCSKNLAPGWYKMRQGTREEARAYSSKGDSRIEGPFEYGQWVEEGQGRRSDLAGVLAAAQGGMCYDEVYTIPYIS